MSWKNPSGLEPLKKWAQDSSSYYLWDVERNMIAINPPCIFPHKIVKQIIDTQNWRDSQQESHAFFFPKSRWIWVKHPFEWTISSNFFPFFGKSLLFVWFLAATEPTEINIYWVQQKQVHVDSDASDASSPTPMKSLILPAVAWSNQPSMVKLEVKTFGAAWNVVGSNWKWSWNV